VLGGLAGVVYNVMSPEFGATGDGVTDDATAIQAAIDAADDAGGGIVFFPAGQYSISSVLDWPGTVSLLGVGASSSAIAQSFNSGHMLSAEVGPTGFPPRVCAGLSLLSLATNTDETVDVEDGALVRMIGCLIAHGGTAAGCILVDASTTTRLSLEHCRLAVATTSTANMIESAGAARITASDCLFVTPATYTPANGIVYGTNITLSRCRFDNSATTSGTVLCVAFNTTTVTGDVQSCTFTNGGGGTVTAIVLGSYATASMFFEAENTFGSSITAYSYTNAIAEPTGMVVLRTRETRAYRLANAADATPDIPVKQYGVISLLSTLAGNSSLAFDGVPPNGARGVILIRNEHGSNRQFTVAGGIIGTGLLAKTINTNEDNAWAYTVASAAVSSTPAIWYAGFWSE